MLSSGINAESQLARAFSPSEKGANFHRFFHGNPLGGYRIRQSRNKSVRDSFESQLDRALFLARYGFDVFPCHEKDVERGGKITHKARSPYTSNGFHAASSDQNQIKKWWKEHPNALIGVPTGRHAGRHGLVVIDLDEKNGKSARRSMEALGLPRDAALTLSTMNGGLHAYYRYPEGVKRIKSTTNLFHDKLQYDSGIDIRGDGGYVILYGDPFALVNADPDLTPLPEAYLSELREVPAKLPAARTAPAGATRLEDVVQKECEIDVEEMLAALKAIPADLNRVGWIRIGTNLKSVLGDNQAAFSIFNEWSATCPEKYHSCEMESVWNSLRPRKVSAKFIFWWAKLNGWRKKKSNTMSEIRKFASELVKELPNDNPTSRRRMEEAITERFNFLPEDKIQGIVRDTVDYFTRNHVSDADYRQKKSDLGKYGNEVKKAKRRAHGETIESETQPWRGIGSRRTYYRRKASKKKVQPAVSVGEVINSENRAYYRRKAEVQPAVDVGEVINSENRGDEGSREARILPSSSSLSVSNRRECQSNGKCKSSVKHSVKHSKDEIATAFDVTRMTVNNWERDGIPARQLKAWRKSGILDEKLALWATLHPGSTG